MVDPLTAAMTASAVISSLQGLKGLLSGSPYEEQRRRLGASAASLERRITSSLTRRLAGTPSATARELGRQAEEGIIRQTEQLQTELGREAQRRGIAGSGIAFAQQRLAGERGIRAATGARRGTELADLQQAEQQAMGLVDRMRLQEQRLKAEDAQQQQTYGQLLGYGAQLFAHQATLRSLTQAGATPATAAAPARPGGPTRDPTQFYRDYFSKEPEYRALYPPRPPQGRTPLPGPNALSPRGRFWAGPPEL